MIFKDDPTERNISLKAIAIAVGGFVIAVVIILVAIRWIRGDGESRVLPLEQQKATIADLCQASEDPTTCKKIKFEQLAVAQQDSDICRDLEGDERDGCLWEVATSSSDASVCKGINTQTFKQWCADGVAYDVAIAASDLKQCDIIQDETKRAGCKVAIEPITAENCLSLGQDPAYCEMLKVATEAVVKQDPRICSALSDEDVSSCIDLVLIDDPDFDGLETFEELEVYKTDPDNPDTDKDGYNDGEEVNAGYNPTGPGLLTAP